MADQVELTELKGIIVHIELAIVSCHFIHFSDVFPLPLIHESEIIEDGSLCLFFAENGQHFDSGLCVKAVAILAFDDFFALYVGEACEVLIIDVFDVYPLDFEVALELESVVFPPEGESFLMIAGVETSYSFEHSTFDCAEE